MTNSPSKDAAAPKKAEAAVKTAQAEAPAEKVAEAKSYTSETPTYVGSELVPAGEVFVTNEPKGKDWKEVTPKEAAAIEAATDLIPDDAQFDEASVEALQAYALIKRVPIVGIAKDREALIAAIKAANEPAL